MYACMYAPSPVNMYAWACACVCVCLYVCIMRSHGPIGNLTALLRGGDGPEDELCKGKHTSFTLINNLMVHVCMHLSLL